MVTKNLCRQEVLVRCKTNCFFFSRTVSNLLIYLFFAAKVSSLRHQKPIKNVYTVHSKAADPRNSDRLEFLTTLEEDEKILCFGVFAHKMLGFAWQFLSIFFVWIWLDFFRHHLLQQSDFVKGNAIETCHPLLYIAPYFPMGKPPLAKIVGRKASLAQSGKLSRPRCPKSPKDRVVSCISWMSGWDFFSECCANQM